MEISEINTVHPISDWSITQDPFGMLRLRFKYLGPAMPGHIGVSEVCALTLHQAEQLISELQNAVIAAKSIQGVV